MPIGDHYKILKNGVESWNQGQNGSAYEQSLEWLLNDLKMPHRPPES